ncbi:MAG: hypothetical protein L0220_14870 [Acidobacteria bacterium]|nr:hypothetical protein [Acidobacteriota bacterium]
MARESTKRTNKTQEPQAAREMNVLWITAGLGCDGESVAITAATQPSIEDVVLGGLPSLPAVKFLNPFYARENGDEFLRYLYLAREDQLDPFILVTEVFRYQTQLSHYS